MVQGAVRVLAECFGPTKLAYGFCSVCFESARPKEIEFQDAFEAGAESPVRISLHPSDVLVKNDRTFHSLEALFTSDMPSPLRRSPIL